MRCLLALASALLALNAQARTDLKQMMSGTCENLGSVKGVGCVKLQRQLENENAALDRNGADLCALVWEWGSHSPDREAAGDLVTACFRQVANLTVTDEVKATCDSTVYDRQEASDSLETIRIAVKHMMDCVGQLAARPKQEQSHE